MTACVRLPRCFVLRDHTTRQTAMLTSSYSTAAMAKYYADVFCSLYTAYPKRNMINLPALERDLTADASSTRAIMATSGSMAAWGVWYRAENMKEGRDPEYYDIVKQCVERFSTEHIAIKKQVIEQLRFRLGPKAENIWRRRLRKYLSLRKPATHSEYENPALIRCQRQCTIYSPQMSELEYRQSSCDTCILSINSALRFQRR